MSLGGAHPSPTAEVCGVGRRQGSFCPPPRASPRGSFGSVTSQGCGVPPSKAAGHRDEAGRTLPVGLVPNSSWVLHSGLQDELPDPHSLAACKEPRCWLWGSRLQPSQTPPAAPRNTPGCPHHSSTMPMWDDGHGPPHPACKAEDGIWGPRRPLSARCTISHCKG